MTTAVSIALYLAAAFFAALTAIVAEMAKAGNATKDQGRFAAALFAMSFLMAAILQVFA